MESNFPRRLSHEVPPWVNGGAVYHIRIRTRQNWSKTLVEERMASGILQSVRYYEIQGTWHCRLFLLMPDHLHALVSFDPARKFREIIGAWKGYIAKTLNVEWQENFFDHRIRSDESLSEKYEYILRNPVALGLCDGPGAWPWKVEMS